MVLNPIEVSILQNEVMEALRTIFDPEIPVNILDMGLIYDVYVETDGFVNIKMTLTAPNCPAAQSLPAEVDQKTRELDGVSDVKVDIVWEPPYSMDMMSEAAKLELGFF